MKKIVLLLGVVAFFASCGTKATKPAEEAMVEETAVTETVVDTLAAVADSVVTAAADSLEVMAVDSVAE